MEVSFDIIGERWVQVLGIMSVRYFGIAGFAFTIFYLLRKYLVKKKKKIQSKDPKTKDYLRDIAYSAFTILVFAFVGASLFIPIIRENSQIYSNVDDMGKGYFVLSIFFMILTHDTYFYWMHRMIHHPKLFQTVHLIHHKSTNPSPWTALAFHPTEAVLEAAVIYLFIFLFPVHRLAIFIFILFMFVYNVYGHLGYELYPKNFQKSRIGKWINTSVSHNQHHHYYHGNYGLYFLFWDRMMGTIREDYDKDFDLATQSADSHYQAVGR